MVIHFRRRGTMGRKKQRGKFHSEKVEKDSRESYHS
jgi:hypothetical protein